MSDSIEFMGKAAGAGGSGRAAAALYGLPPPEEKTKMNLKAQSREEIIGTTYDAWLNIAEQYKISFDSIEPLYNQACKIVEPFKERLSGKLTEKYIGCVAKNPGPAYHFNSDLKTAAGLYLSALLNETSVEELSIRRFPVILNELGYSLDGKILRILEGAEVGWVGERARSGLVEVLGRADYVGDKASGGLFVVHGSVKWVGWEAEGGMFVVPGSVKWVGDKASGGVFVVPGRAEWVGFEASGGVFVVKQKPQNSFMYDANDNAIRVGPEELEKDADLVGMLNEIEKICKASDVPNMNKLAKQIDAHVREKYARRIA